MNARYWGAVTVQTASRDDRDHAQFVVGLLDALRYVEPMKLGVYQLLSCMMHQAAVELPTTLTTRIDGLLPEKLRSRTVTVYSCNGYAVNFVE